MPGFIVCPNCGRETGHELAHHVPDHHGILEHWDCDEESETVDHA